MAGKKKAGADMDMTQVHILPVERVEPSLTATDVDEVLREAGVLVSDRKAEWITAALQVRLTR